MERNYKKLSIEDFGKHLIESNDLDPVYVALHKTHLNSMTTDQLCRWVLAYILCYHVGASCWLSEKEGSEFFSCLMVAAINKQESPVGGRWPRSHERRHWRGKFAEDVVIHLIRRYDPRPEGFLSDIAGAALEYEGPTDPILFQSLSMRVQDHYGFGGWATFKLADLIDRLGLHAVDFAYSDVVIYKDPVEAAKRLFRERHDLSENVEVKSNAVKDVFDYLIDYFQEYHAPPLYDRSIGLQEVETILCKWKSHMNGRYPLNNDIREIKEGLGEWSVISETAKVFAENMPTLKGE